jgi:putative FmdB family regulatory protein
LPIYEYMCENGHKFEVLCPQQKQNEVHECDQCGSKETHKVISAANFQFKGTGFHCTDYGKRGPKNRGNQ